MPKPLPFTTKAEHCRVAGRKQMGNAAYFPEDLIPEDLRSKHFCRKPLCMTQVLCSPCLLRPVPSRVGPLLLFSRRADIL